MLVNFFLEKTKLWESYIYFNHSHLRLGYHAYIHPHSYRMRWRIYAHSFWTDRRSNPNKIALVVSSERRTARQGRKNVRNCRRAQRQAWLTIERPAATRRKCLCVGRPNLTTVLTLGVAINPVRGKLIYASVDLALCA